MTATDDKARFAAREFVGDFERKATCVLPADLVERMEFAFEMGYLRGRRDLAEEMTAEIGGKP